MNIRKFLRRAIIARRFGVTFFGTTRTRLPARLKIAGQWQPVRFPEEHSLVADFIDVVLEDDYGLRQISKPPAMIVDIGANVGIFCNFARDCFPDATIQAYEPSPETAAFAKENTSGAKVTVFVEGVAASEGRGEMIDYGASNIARTHVVEEGAIKLTSFATVLARAGGHIDLLKIDCEGAEWDFMTDPDLFAHVDEIRMEYHLIDGRQIKDVTALATHLGFRVAQLSTNDGFGIAWMNR